VTIVLHRGMSAYICGEETALGRSRKARSTAHEARFRRCGARRLTVVNNVETMATSADHRDGRLRVRQARRASSRGTRVVSISGHIENRGNYEIERNEHARVDLALAAAFRTGASSNGHSRRLMTVILKGDGVGSRLQLFSS
jgi:NADH-quinone oxidoreductase subunit F